MKTKTQQLAAIEIVDLGPFEAEEVEVTVKHSGPSTKPANKYKMRIPRDRSMSLPVLLAHQSHEMSLNAFRNFGINE